MREEPRAGYPAEWLRGVLGLAVLRVVAGGPTYGYAIALALAEAGFGTIKGGTLYPLLGRFEAAGHVVAHWREGDGGPGRKYYEITDEGRELLHEQGRAWADFATQVARFVSEPHLEGPGR